MLMTKRVNCANQEGNHEVLRERRINTSHGAKQKTPSSFSADSGGGSPVPAQSLVMSDSFMRDLSRIAEPTLRHKMIHASFTLQKESRWTKYIISNMSYTFDMRS